MAILGTTRLKVANGSASVTKLWNGRYRLEFLCDPASDKTDWYYENIGGILPDFAASQDAFFGKGVDESWQAIPESVYPNMVCVEASYPYIPSLGEKRVSLAYETLTSSWVEEKDEDIDYELNGLQRVSRTSVALPETDYTKVVGTDTIEVDGDTLTLGAFKIEKTDAMWSLTETWLESGILSVSQQFVGGSATVQVQAFNKTSSEVNTALSEVTTSHLLISEKEDDYEGIKTSTYQYQLDESFTEDYELNGLKRISLIELSVTNFTAQTIGDVSASAPTTGLYLGTQKIDNGGTIKLRESVWLEAGVISRNIRESNSGDTTTGKIRTEVVETLKTDPISTISGVKIGDEESNFEGMQTRRHTFVVGEGQIKVSTRPAQPALAGTNYVTVESVGTAISPPGVLVESSDTNDDGFIRYTRTSLQGTIEGVKTTYKDVADVRVAGTVNLASVSKSTGGISGTIAVADVTPPRTKTIAATVTIEITTTPPDTVDIAYDLGNISCSVTSISMSENYRGSDVFTTSSGNSRYSGARKTADMSARVSTYPECYLSGLTSNGGTFSYTSSYENQSTSPNTIVAVGQSSTTKTFVDGTGSTSEDYSTTGVLKRSTRPILTAIDGTVYYEVITWEA